VDNLDATSHFDEQILNDVVLGRAALFLGAGFALASRNGDGQRDKRGLREHLLKEFDTAISGAPFDMSALRMEDIVLYLEARGGVARAAIEESLRRFLGTSDDLQRLEAFTLLRTLFERRSDIFEAIVTTNWDNGLETALADLPTVTLATVADEGDLLPAEADVTLLLKIHGDLSGRRGRLVISSADFDLYDWEHPRMVERLRSILSSRYLLVMGYSAQDENFRRIVRHVHYDLGDRFRGGWIVSPDLADREKLWTSEVGFRHIATTADRFLREILQFATTDGWGEAIDARRKLQRSAKRERLTASPVLDRLAQDIRQRFRLRHAWVVEPRTRREDANARVDFALACVLESMAHSAKEIALATGMTVEYALKHLDPSAFSRRAELYSTVIVLNAQGGYRDPSAMVDVASSVLGTERSRAHVLRACGLDGMLGAGGEMDALITLAKELLRRAVNADVLLSSVRPVDWYGHEGEARAPIGRTLPFTEMFSRSAEDVARGFEKAGVVAIHQMIPLNATGEDAGDALAEALGEPRATVVRPTVDELKAAAKSGKQQVIVAASHERKLPSVLAVLNGSLCNTLVVDAALARALVDTSEFEARDET
jgi:DNA-binding transcriptional regulator LsrR (DeoR family)